MGVEGGLPAIGQVGVVGAGFDRSDRLGIGVAVMVERVRVGLRTHGVDRFGVAVSRVMGVGCAGVRADGRRHLRIARDRRGDVGLREGPGVMRVRVGGMGGHRVGRHGVAMVGSRFLVEHARGRVRAERLVGDIADLAEGRSVVGADRGDRLGVGVSGVVGVRVPGVGGDG